MTIVEKLIGWNWGLHAVTNCSEDGVLHTQIKDGFIIEPLKLFKALGHEFRFQVIQLLLEGKIHSCCNEIRSCEQACCVTDLTVRFQMSKSTISHHLGILVDSGIVNMEKRGLWSIYVISPQALQSLHDSIEDWMGRYNTTENPNLGSDCLL